MVHLHDRDGLVQRAVVRSIRMAAGGGASAEVPAGGAALLVEEAAEDACDREDVEGAEDGHLDHEPLQTLHPAAVAAQGQPNAVDGGEASRDEANADGEAGDQRYDDELDQPRGTVRDDRRGSDEAETCEFVGVDLVKGQSDRGADGG